MTGWPFLANGANLRAMDWRNLTALVVALGIWFTVIVFLGASGVVHKSPELLAAAMVVPLIVILVVTRVSQSLAQAERSVAIDALIFVSAVRILCGMYFFEMGTGINADWAVPAAISGILIGLTSIPVALFAIPASHGLKWFALFIWNLIGFVDAVVAPFSAIVLGMVDRGSMLSLNQMPMFIFAAFVLPLVLWTHFRISSRIWNQQTS